MRHDLPTGTVTFLFTDIEGSTRLLNELGDDYAAALGQHRRILRKALTEHSGVEVDTQGDAFFVAFSRASDALAAALDAQHALADGPVRVRMGVHTGEPIITDEGYVGMDVHHAARIAGAGHGGQVLVSQAVHDLVERADLRDLGTHRLKDLSAPERIWQLGDGDFPRLRTLYQTNLPVPTTPFIGREREVAEVIDLLTRSRCVTLTGPGGSGKTRLALQAAAAVAEAYPSGVWWVPLAPLSQPSGVVAAAVRSLGGGSNRLADVIGDRRMLLVLDNFEHVMDAVADLASVRASCPQLHLLVTSRERLRIGGEQVYTVPPLAEGESRTLFLDRARSASGTPGSTDAVDALCAQLDHLPLAIELAAARTATLTAEDLLGRLGRRLDLLRGGRDAETRQATLRATIEWSVDLLTEAEAAALTRLAVFRGGWTIAAAEQVCGVPLEVLESLVDKSLVRRGEARRFGMLETIRQFAAEQLDDSGERGHLLDRLMQYLLVVAEAMDLIGPGGDEPRLRAVGYERANIDIALRHAVRSGDVSSGLRLVSLLETYWISDPLGALRWLDVLLDIAGEDLDPRVRGGAYRARGGLLQVSGHSDLAEREYDRALRAMEEVGDDDAAHHLLHRIASSALDTGDIDRAERLAEQALAHDRRHGRRGDEAIALRELALIAYARGNLGRARALSAEAIDAAEEAGFLWWRAAIQVDLADWSVSVGDAEPEAAALGAAVRMLAAVGDRLNMLNAMATGAQMCVLIDDLYRGGALWGAIDAEEQRLPVHGWQIDRARYADTFADLKGEEFLAGLRRGRAMTLDEALELITDK